MIEMALSGLQIWNGNSAQISAFLHVHDLGWGSMIKGRLPRNHKD